jgi:hypothetical protein
MFSDQLLFPGKEKYDTVIKKAKKFGMNIDKEQASNIIQKVIDKNVIALTAACVNVKITNSSLNLKTLYRMADLYVSKMRKIILESNK